MRLIVSILMLVASLSAQALTTLPQAATGHWKSSFYPGFELQVVVGKYFIDSPWAFPTCGSALHIDAAVPRAQPSEGLHGRARKLYSMGGPVTAGTLMPMIKVVKPGLLGFITVNWYDPVSDSLSVSFQPAAGTGGLPTGTFVLYRDQLVPKVAPVDPC